MWLIGLGAKGTWEIPWCTHSALEQSAFDKHGGHMVFMLLAGQPGHVSLGAAAAGTSSVLSALLPLLSSITSSFLATGGRVGAAMGSGPPSCSYMNVNMHKRQMQVRDVREGFQPFPTGQVSVYRLLPPPNTRTDSPPNEKTRLQRSHGRLRRDAHIAGLESRPHRRSPLWRPLIFFHLCLRHFLRNVSLHRCSIW